jgi:hypothetical protein
LDALSIHDDVEEKNRPQLLLCQHHSSTNLPYNNPDDILGSFFIADDESGTGPIFVSLRDGSFDLSHIFDHCAKLIDTLQKMD